MRKIFFTVAFVLLGTLAFANNSVEQRIETKVVDGEVICHRSCFYQGGELLGCTEWECEKIATEELDEVVIQG